MHLINHQPKSEAPGALFRLLVQSRSPVSILSVTLAVCSMPFRFSRSQSKARSSLKFCTIGTIHVLPQMEKFEHVLYLGLKWPLLLLCHHLVYPLTMMAMAQLFESHSTLLLYRTMWSKSCTQRYEDCQVKSFLSSPFLYLDPTEKSIMGEDHKAREPRGFLALVLMGAASK